MKAAVPSASGMRCEELLELTRGWLGLTSVLMPASFCARQSVLHRPASACVASRPVRPTRVRRHWRVNGTRRRSASSCNARNR